MPEMEKVIKGLDCCLGSNDCDIERKEDCPYKGMYLCAMFLRCDILALLKEREARIKELEEKLRLLEYGNQDVLQSGMMPAT